MQGLKSVKGILRSETLRVKPIMRLFRLFRCLWFKRIYFDSFTTCITYYNMQIFRIRTKAYCLFSSSPSDWEANKKQDCWAQINPYVSKRHPKVEGFQYGNYVRRVQRV